MKLFPPVHSNSFKTEEEEEEEEDLKPSTSSLILTGRPRTFSLSLSFPLTHFFPQRTLGRNSNCRRRRQSSYFLSTQPPSPTPSREIFGGDNSIFGEKDKKRRGGGAKISNTIRSAEEGGKKRRLTFRFLASPSYSSYPWMSERSPEWKGKQKKRTDSSSFSLFYFGRFFRKGENSTGYCGTNEIRKTHLFLVMCWKTARFILVSRQEAGRAFLSQEGGG